ncbi:GNAT family N-acetyltransferase [Tunicatimonas pelagia]|uniref:GNAT family N-acetyltransferase n=1 Tax=Tunicatimonas pelagia TaxID=931531 RepID=UPI002666F57B|nr:GNAT family N-acetyltransferase [Tunicatimonas pelagia]WKN40453.1 GNAT family N-acetyltransferase [Tunicatimonas pelagia]
MSELDPVYEIRSAQTKEDFQQAARLFRAYADWLQIDLCYQNFEQELATLPKMYGEKQGKLLLAWVENTVAGCVGVRQFGESVGEMKRLYVPAKFQGKGIGKALARQIIQEAKKLGYTEMVLDTLEQMKAARKLYHALGFQETSAYYANPLPEVIYLKLDLFDNKI